VSPRLEVVLVRPKEDGNVGAVARLSKNFGVDRISIVDPRAPLGQEARRRAMAGLPFLKGARVVDTFEEAIVDADLVVGTTDLSTGRSTQYLRRSVSPERLGEIVHPIVGRVALVFGPEDNGLDRDQLHRCDLLVHIPARREFPTLNLSHAAGIVLYAIHRAEGPESPESTPAPEILELRGNEKELFLARMSELAEKAGYPGHKRAGLDLMFRRILGRATPTESEYRMLLGFLRSVNRLLKKTHG
jgi:tRNA/rRNA methyltransferase